MGAHVPASGHKVWGIEAVNENIVWGLTYNYQTFVKPEYLIKTIDGGASWTATPIDIPSNLYTLHVYPLDVNTAWLATTDEANPISGKIFKTTDGGQTWAEQGTAFTGFNETPAGVYFWNQHEGVAFGATANTIYNDQISVYRTENGGTNWTKVVSPDFPDQLPHEGLWVYCDNGFFEVRGDNVWFVTNGPRIFRSADKGKTWTAHDTGLGNAYGIAGIAFKDTLNGIVVARSPNAAARTIDGGITWEPISIPATPPAIDIVYVPGTQGTYVLHNATADWIGNSSLSLVSLDDGINWGTLSVSPNFDCMEFISPGLGYAGGLISSTVSGVYKWTGGSLKMPLFVNDNASGANDGTSWADAFTDLQAALAIAEDGDQIWVAEGTYKPAASGGPQTATFLIDKNLRLYGGFVGTEARLSDRGDPAEHPSVLTGDLNGDDVVDNFAQNRADNVLHVVTMTAAINNETIIDGFTLKSGHADADTQPDSHGGAINSGGNPIVRHCIFTQNFSIDRGGAAFFLNASVGTSRFEHCDFIKNNGNAGGAVDLRFSNGYFDDCLFLGNFALDAGVTAFQENGGSISTRNGNLEINGCMFTSNWANFGGGALIYFVDDVGDSYSLVVDSCSFDLNSCQVGGSAIITPIFGKNVSIQLSNSSFNQNDTEMSYAAVQAYTDADNSSLDVTIENCQFTGNTAYGSSGMDIGALGNGSIANFIVSNCLFKDNNASHAGGAMDIFANAGTTANFMIEGCRYEGNAANNRAGALWISNSSDQFQATVARCEFLNNSSNSGAAVAVFQDDFIQHIVPQNASVNFDNCLFVGNSSNDATIALDSLPGVQFLNCSIADNQGNGIQLADKSTLTLQNTILYNPGFTEYTATTGDVTFTSHSGNLVADASLAGLLMNGSDKQELNPLFMGGGDYHLTANSPCVDTGNPDGVTATTDLGGDPRVQGGRVDMGAYESPFVSSTKEKLAGEVAVSPNPASDYLNLELPEDLIGLFDVQVIDAKGRLVLLSKGQRLDVQGLTAGMYSLRVVMDERVFLGRFTKI